MTWTSAVSLELICFILQCSLDLFLDWQTYEQARRFMRGLQTPSTQDASYTLFMAVIDSVEGEHKFSPQEAKNHFVHILVYPSCRELAKGTAWFFGDFGPQDPITGRHDWSTLCLRETRHST